MARIGVSSFVEPLHDAGGNGVQADWSVPARGGPDLYEHRLGLARAHGAKIARANSVAGDRLLEGDPGLERCAAAKDVGSGLGPGSIYHAGPPVAW